MKVLHLPVNIASIPSHTVRGLRKIGIDARGLIFDNKYCQLSEGLNVINVSEKRKLEKDLKKIIFAYNFFRWATWADVIHWYFGHSVLPWNVDIKFIHLLKKPAIIEWLGSDIRIPEIEFNDNPYYRKIFKNIKTPSAQFKKSIKKQKIFLKHGFVSLVPPCMEQYLLKKPCTEFFILRQRIMVSDYSPSFPSSDNQHPVVVHISTNPFIKGTSAIVEIVSKLKKRYNFEFKLASGVSYSQAMNLIQQADVFLDQFILGSYGMACLEAMAFGKPVVSYIKPSLITKYPHDLPIINANLENLELVLEELLLDGRKRQELGIRGRTYVEKYHDAIKLANDLVRIYSTLISQKR
ncbi:MAG TPA: glycosyltransferase [bacterium]|nr:glycosyltransferase [bacterium]